MSKVHFVEEQSQDPVEQAIARKVIRILNDPSLDRQRRATLVQRAQQELVAHRRRLVQEQALRQRVASTALPSGYRAVAVQVSRGLIRVAASKPGSFIWVDAGRAPAGVAHNLPARALRKPRRPGRQRNNRSGNAVAERRLALQAGRA